VERAAIGRRIVVYGVTGSGKTTVSRRLGALLDLPVIELDALFWRPRWEETPREEFRAKVVDALERSVDGWVVDGNYSSVRDAVLPRAATVVWLRLPWRVTFWRLLLRTLGRAWTREPLWGTNHESLRQTFLSRNSILWWSIKHHRAHRRNVLKGLRTVSHSARVVTLRSQGDVDRFLAALAAAASDPVP
jgi:adenylate kinase family enzyme